MGQNVNSYGNDIDDDKTTFANLLKAIAHLEGDFRIKFMTSHPKDLTEEVVDVIATEPKIAKLIHLPVQAGSNRVLKMMNRRYTREHYLGLIEMIRNKISNCYISTDIIVGFPGETEEEFLETYDLVDKVRFDGVFAFMYSKRDGTVAADMDGQLDITTKRQRVNKLLALSKNIIKEKNKETIGSMYNVIIDSYDCDKNEYHASTHSGKSITLQNLTTELVINNFYNVRITEFKNNKLYAELVKSEN